MVNIDSKSLSEKYQRDDMQKIEQSFRPLAEEKSCFHQILFFFIFFTRSRDYYVL